MDGGDNSHLPPSGHVRGGSVNGDEPKLFTNKAGSVGSEMSGE